MTNDSRAQSITLGLLMIAIAVVQSAPAAGQARTAFTGVPPQFIAALAESGAKSGNHAESWGLWRVDPGPRGIGLDSYERLKAAGGIAPAQWKFDSKDWWLEENGRIMEKPVFPLAPGKYLVTGDREVAAELTIHPPNRDGHQRWELSNGATIHDVTHLGCRSARYTPATGQNSCSPANAPKSAFRVAAGQPMPPVEGCNKQDYAVLIVIGVAADSAQSKK